MKTIFYFYLVSGHGAGVLCESHYEPPQNEHVEDEEVASRKHIKQNQNKEVTEVKTKDKRKSRK